MTSPTPKPSASTPEWKRETAVFRALRCVTFLKVHGLMSDSEGGKVSERTVKWAQKAARRAGR